MDNDGNNARLCPYCDGTPTLQHHPDHGYYVECEACELDCGFGMELDPVAVVALWNEWVGSTLEILERVYE